MFEKRPAKISSAREDASPVVASVVAKRVCDLLLSFPCSAAGGVQWKVLARRYEERFSSRLDVEALGHASPLCAASALLWDVVRLVDTDDVENPIVGIEDGVALTPQPGLLASWPSLYEALCRIVQEHGTPEATAGADPATKRPGEARAYKLLFSQLRPLLERHWHADFDESILGFRNEEGTFIRLKKMKHLLAAVLGWRTERAAWRRGKGVKPSAVDKVLEPELHLVPSKSHNDLMLVCTVTCQGSGSEDLASPWQSSEQVCSSGIVEDHAACCRVQLSIADGRAVRDEHVQCGEACLVSQAEFQIPADLFDNPFEPPPELGSWMCRDAAPMSPMSSCTRTSAAFGSETVLNGSLSSGFIFGSSGWQSQYMSACVSGSVTPARQAKDAHMGCAVIPVWLPYIAPLSGMMDVAIIPRGIVQSARQQFERN